MIYITLSSVFHQKAISPILEDVLYILLIIALFLVLFLLPIGLLCWLWLKRWKQYLGSLKAAFKRLFINIGIIAGYIGLMYLVVVLGFKVYEPSINIWIFLFVPLVLIVILFTYWKNYEVEIFKKGESLRKMKTKNKE